MVFALAPLGVALGEEAAAPETTAEAPAPGVEGGAPETAPPADPNPLTPKQKEDILSRLTQALLAIGTPDDAKGREAYAALRPDLERDPEFLDALCKEFDGSAAGSAIETFLLLAPRGLLSFRDKDKVAKAFLAKIRRERARASERLFIEAGKMGGPVIVKGLCEELAADPERGYASRLCQSVGLTRDRAAIRPLLQFAKDHASGQGPIAAFNALITLIRSREVAFSSEDFSFLVESLPVFDPVSRQTALGVCLTVLQDDGAIDEELIVKFRDQAIEEARGRSPSTQVAAFKILTQLPEEHFEAAVPVFAQILDPAGTYTINQQIDLAADLRFRKFPAEVVPLLLPLYAKPKNLTQQLILLRTLQSATGRRDLPNDPIAWQAWWDQNRESEINRLRAKMLENAERKKKAAAPEP